MFRKGTKYKVTEELAPLLTIARVTRLDGTPFQEGDVILCEDVGEDTGSLWSSQCKWCGLPPTRSSARMWALVRKDQEHLTEVVE